MTDEEEAVEWSPGSPSEDFVTPGPMVIPHATGIDHGSILETECRPISPPRLFGASPFGFSDRPRRGHVAKLGFGL